MVLGTLASSTGGTALSGNDFLGEFNRLANPPEYVYYLGFYPKDLKPDGKYHEIKVTLANNKGLSVQARKGYWAPSMWRSSSRRHAEIGEAVFSHDELRDVPIDIHSQFYKTTADEAKVKVTTHIDIQQLPLRKQSDERSHDDVTLVCALFDRNGNYVKGTQKTVEIRLKDENLERWRTHGVTVNSDFDIKSGAYMIRVVVRDAEGQQWPQRTE